MGFIAESCRRMGRPFSNTAIDSLILAQNLLPDLGKYKLDIVAEHLELPKFRHHRASDDAATVAYMLPHFFRKMEELGLRRLSEINHIVAHRLDLQIVVPGGDSLQLLPAPAVHQGLKQLPRLG